MLYIEKLSLFSFCFYVLPYYIKNKIKSKKTVPIYYFYSPSIIGRLISSILNDIIKPYETEIRDIKHSNGECVIARLQRKDVFDFRSQIINCNVFRALYNDKWNKERLPYYISKGLNGKQSFIEDPNSEMIVNNLYSIQKVYWGMLNHSKEKCEFIFINRPWFSIYKEYANNLNIKLIKTPQLRSSLINIIKLKVSKISWGKYILKYIRNKILYRTYFTWQKKNKIKDNAMIFFEGLPGT